METIPYVFYTLEYRSLLTMKLDRARRLRGPISRWRTAKSVGWSDPYKVYDYFLTFEDERRLVWPSKTSFLKVIFFVNRYFAFIETFGLLYGTSRFVARLAKLAEHIFLVIVALPTATSQHVRLKLVAFSSLM